MATAAALSRNHEVTIVAKNLPGDAPTIEWASPWAGASFIAGSCSSLQEAKMQLEAFAELWRLSIEHPESSVKRILIEDLHDNKTEDEVWWKDFMPEVSPLARIGDASFKRMNLSSLSDACSLGHDVLVNATGFGSLTLADVLDEDVDMVRGQTMVVRSDYNKLFMRDSGDRYTYAIPRLDGTVVLGGVRQRDTLDSKVDWDICRDIAQRIHKNLPDHFPAEMSDLQNIGHNVGIRPGRRSGIRIEKEEKNGQKIVHVYGAAGGGYIFGAGMARAAATLVEEFLTPSFPAKL
ncbi:hypothetical protein LTR70_000015 [Exophiala xenobiotica]|uniref:FAD dependent oxidoreductase domain-containing protein n=1 Tax=Lithohypha guttulata TaxID=1690604 RepID=A0ABR0K5Z0_9EURO|nr:hypothetical protein LTR24_006947 [Lithohypha guttulata]KAK5330693.1 hypothetical protein LTR70_000015 [Exophiala xenobiotica]